MIAAEYADWLYRSIQTREVMADPIGGLPAALADNYAIQDALVVRMSEDDGPVVGWKIALTSPVMQAMCGVDHPCAGAVLRDRVHHSPAVCNTSKLGRLGAEAEIAFAIGRDMRGLSKPYTAESAADSISIAYAAIELVDDRNADYSRMTAQKLVANNSLNAAIVLGSAVEDWRLLDLRSARGEMRIDGAPVATGVGADILGHPLNAVAWLANNMLTRGRMLRAGDVVMCGSFVRTQFPATGQTVACWVEGLGEATVTVS